MARGQAPGVGRVDPAEWAGLRLRAHELLSAVPLHDVWSVDLPEGGPGRTLLDLRAALAPVDLRGASGAVRLLFRIRAGLGRLFRWDAGTAAPAGLADRLPEEDRRRSRVAPGTREGPFQVVLVSERESIAEIRNATAHAFSVFAWCERGAGYRLCWAIYVEPVGRITGWYMALIDPFRRRVVYPAILRRIRRAWAEHVAREAPLRSPP